MKQYKVTPLVGAVVQKYIRAKISKVHEDIRVIEDSDEIIFNETYVSGMLPNNRVCKFKKSTLEFL